MIVFRNVKLMGHHAHRCATSFGSHYTKKKRLTKERFEILFYKNSIVA